MTREEAITALGDRNNLLWGMSKEEKKYYSEALDMAISALSENKGEWIDEFGGCECSECGCLEAGHSNYCPNCGARMKGGE